MRFVPYAVGLFMLTPIIVWFALWLFAFPGIKSGFDVPLALSLFAVSVPLVVTFLITNIAFIANSMAGSNEFGPPAWTPARRLLAAQPAAAVVIGAATVPYLTSVGEPWYLAAVPLVTGIGFALAIRLSIARQAGGAERRAMPEAAQRPRRPAAASPAPQATAHAAPQTVARAAPRRPILNRIPVLGRFVRELVEDYAQERTFFALNLGLLWLGAAVLFGLPVIFYTALVLVPVAFALIIAVTRG